MRSILAVAMLATLGTQAQVIHSVPTIDLDKPGALAKLAHEHPGHYRRVVDTLLATERMNCAIDLQMYRAGDMDKACTSHLIRTSYPAQVFLSIPVDHNVYKITAYLDRSPDRLEPADFVK
jgi:hypothetical protein